ncbi:MAG: response regulator [Pseudomonadota bacterium]
MLYLEDEALIALDGRMMLEDLGFGDVRMAHSLGEAENLAADGVDLAVLDINLGDGTTSISFAERLAKTGTPIIFASGYNAAEKIVSHIGGPLMAKPFTQNDLARAVDDALDMRPA